MRVIEYLACVTASLTLVSGVLAITFDPEPYNLHNPDLEVPLTDSADHDKHSTSVCDDRRNKSHHSINFASARKRVTETQSGPSRLTLWSYPVARLMRVYVQDNTLHRSQLWKSLLDLVPSQRIKKTPRFEALHVEAQPDDFQEPASKPVPHDVANDIPVLSQSRSLFNRLQQQSISNSAIRGIALYAAAHLFFTLIIFAFA